MPPRRVQSTGSRREVVRVVGRPRKVTDATIAEILAWHASRETCAQVAKRLGVCESTVRRVIRHRGRHYKQSSPDDSGGGRHAMRARANRIAMTSRATLGTHAWRPRKHRAEQLTPA
jgi:IS30 family transposase